MNQLQVDKLYEIAGGLNIEGGYPANCLVRDNRWKPTLWANIILILDRPLVDNIIFDELPKKMKTNNYPLLENTIDDINEHKMFATYLMIVGYYLEHGRKLLDKKETDKLIIMIHMHQDVASVGLLNILADMINNLRKHYNITNTIIKYKTDDHTFNPYAHNYTGIDILLSLSQCAGLDPYLKPGELIITDEFIPYDIINKKIITKSKYKSQNHLKTSISDILNSKYHDYSINYVNKNYVSKNKSKNYDAYKLTVFDFPETPILQADRLWNPIDKTELIDII